MKFLIIQKTTQANQKIINLDNINYISMNTKTVSCEISFANNDKVFLDGSETAQLIAGIKQYNDQLLVNLCGEAEF